MKELDHFLTKFCLSTMKSLGIVPEYKFTLRAGIIFTGYFCALLTLPYMTWCGIVRPIMCAQYFCLSIIHSGLFIPLFYYRKAIISVCKQCETMPNIDAPFIQNEYKILQKEIINSFERKYARYHNNIVTTIAGSMVVFPFVFNFIKKDPIELPFSGFVDNMYIFSGLYTAQALYLLVAFLSCNGLVDIFSMIIMHMKIQYQLIEKVLIELSTVEDREYILRQCIIHHMKLIEIFKEIKTIFRTVLFWIYIGLFSSSAVTRAAIMDDMNLSLLPPMIGETIYLSPYCLSMSALIDANQMVRFALYNTEWHNLPMKMRKSIHIMMLRMIRDPNISIYANGPALTNSSYASLINATFTYIASAILMG